jgi:hypothetical protein
MRREISDHPSRAGRPRKHQSDAERIRAFRSAHGLRKLTVDVPTKFADEVRDYARQLRKAADAASKVEDSFHSSFEPKEAAASYVLSTRWKRTARGAYELLLPPPYWIGGRILKVPRHEPAWQWEVSDGRSLRSIAEGKAIDFGRRSGWLQPSRSST